MKKLLFVTAALAAFSTSWTASALDTNVVLRIRAASLPLSADLGALTLTALGAEGQDCVYLANWTSPYNPNDVALCVLRERRTPARPSCIENSLQHFTTFVSAGSNAQGNPTACRGFDTLGVGYDDVTISAGEFAAAPILQGIAVYPTAIPLMLAIEAA